MCIQGARDQAISAPCWNKSLATRQGVNEETVLRGSSASRHARQCFFRRWFSADKQNGLSARDRKLTKTHVIRRFHGSPTRAAALPLGGGAASCCWSRSTPRLRKRGTCTSSSGPETELLPKQEQEIPPKNAEGEHAGRKVGRRRFWHALRGVAITDRRRLRP